ncbi:hypothetical protein [Flavobacterium sp. SM2513]|uniref:hypothetical protein n=1 Tax=Flavobacterium sp. SM2513 TaxID=3424766 RepID=UPI003D7F7FF2
MKYILAFSLLITCYLQEVNAQVFKSDWDTFKSSQYTIDFKTNITTYFSIDNIGEIHFTSKSDASKFAVFYVFNAEKITEEFINDDMTEQVTNSCVSLPGGALSSFYYEKYYYLLTPWQNCEITKDVLFTDLPQEVFDFIFQ